MDHLKSFTEQPYEVIFVDNGSTDGTEEYLADLCAKNPNYILIRNPKNIGAGPATNQGIEMSRGDTLVFLNNDVLVTPNWLTGLKKCLESRPGIAFVGPMTNNVSGIQQVNEGKYSTPAEMLGFAADFKKAFKRRYFSHWRLPFFCVMVKREVIDAIGMFDDRFVPGNFEDDDLCARALQAGYVNYVAGDTFVHHFGSDAWGPGLKELLERNKAKFLEKHLKTSISCCMIVKDEEKVIERCLDRILPLVDELVIVDTGSTDKTMELIKEHDSPKVKTYTFEWCNDFSAARNFSLSKATKDWIFVLDADEVVTEIDRTNLYPNTAYRYETRNYTENILWTGNRNSSGEYGPDEAGPFWFPSTKIRLFPNDKRIRFQYPVHEVVEESAYQLGLFIDTSPVPIHHSGRLDLMKEDDKGKRYLELLKQIVADNPSDIRNLDQLAAHNQVLKRWDDAISTWERIISLDPKYKAAWHNKGHALVQRDHDFTEAIKCFEKAMEIDPKDRDARYNYGYSHYKMGNYPKALETAESLIAEYPDYILAQALKNSTTHRMEAKNGGSTNYKIPVWAV